MNSMFRILIASAVVVVLPGTTLHAQPVTEEIPPPKFPIPLRAPANASWTIKVEGGKKASEQEGGGSESPSTPSQIVVTKTSPIYMETASISGGGTIQKWVFLTPAKTYRFARQGSSGKWDRLRDEFYNDIPRYEQSDFEDFEWISKENYKGVESVEGRPAYAFELVSRSPITRRDQIYYDPGKSIDADPSSAPQQTFRSNAWLDAKTLLPIKVDDGRQTRTFTFGETPASKLSPPADVLAALKEWVGEDRRIDR